MADPPPFDLRPHEPKQSAPSATGFDRSSGEVYAEVETAIRTTLANRTVADVLDTTLAEHPLPTTAANHVLDPEPFQTLAP